MNDEPTTPLPPPVLSQRLSAIADLVPTGGVAADICADHCLLAIGLATSGRVRRVIAIDIAAAPAAKGAERVRQHGVQDRVEVRVDDGFAALANNEAATAIISGIGGRAMVAILGRGTPDRRGVKALVLQANKDVDAVRAWLDDNGWAIEDEALVWERKRWFPIVRAVRAGADTNADNRAPTPRVAQLLGPVLLRRGGLEFARYVAHTLRWMRAQCAVPSPANLSARADVQAIEDAMSPPADAEIRRIEAAETAPLRQQILRPTLSLDALVYPGDEHPLSAHFGAFIGERMVGIASVYRMAMDGSTEGTAWRLRGMGVLPELHGMGIGAALLRATVNHASEHGGTRYWCNARTVARGFYVRLGLTIEGDEFEVDGVGPHFVMARTIGPAA